MNPVIAHLTWFVSQNELPQGIKVPDLFNGLNSSNAPFIVSALFALGIGIFLHRYFRNIAWVIRLRKRLRKKESLNTAVVRIGLGISLIASSNTGDILGPDFVFLVKSLWSNTDISMVTSVMIVQFILGLLLLIGIFPQIAALLVSMIYFIVAVFAPPGLMINYLVFIGSLWYVFSKSHSDRFSVQPRIYRAFFSSLCYRLEPYSIPVFRITAGISLISVAIQEKLLNPFYGLIFLENHHFNFMKTIGFEFSDEYFLFAAAVVEILVGIILILGILPRLTATLMLGLFLTTFYLLGMTELAGHAIFIALIFVLLTSGAGKKLTLIAED